MTFDTGAASPLTEWNAARSMTVPTATYVFGTWVRCSSVVNTGYLVNCDAAAHKCRWIVSDRSASDGELKARHADLLVELADVVAGLVLRLNVSGVLLDFLRCRHL